MSGFTDFTESIELRDYQEYKKSILKRLGKSSKQY